MPFVEVNIIKGASAEQKAELIDGITDLLVKVLDKNRSSTQVMINEVETENWGVSGRSVATLRAEGLTSNISKS